MDWAWFKKRSRAARRVDSGVGRVELEQSAAHFDGAVFDAAPVGLVRLDLEARVQVVNLQLAALVGRNSADLIGCSVLDIVFPPDCNRLHDAMQYLRKGSDSDLHIEIRLLHAFGHTPWVRLHVRAQRDAKSHEQQLLFFMLALEDISALKRDQEFAELSEQRFQHMVENLSTVIWMLTPDLSRVLYVNEAFETIWGLPRQTLYANPLCFFDLIHPDDLARVAQAYSGSEREWEVSYRILRPDGEQRHLRDIGRGVFDERGELLYFTSNSIDVTAETAVREEFRDLNMRLQEANLLLKQSARIDSLTGCLNRAALIDEAAKAMQIDTRYGRNSTLVFFDLNDFKQINDSFGHHIGDRALMAFADQIRARLRNTDELGRYGGDEFIALLRETDIEQAQALVETLLPVVVETDDGNSVIVRYSAGIAPINDPSIESVDDWIRVADHQMYSQKMQRSRR
jgi:diguanylate cyclase (GGDEF)-like protein/PAS domain S-box-containing protein